MAFVSRWVSRCKVDGSVDVDVGRGKVKYDGPTGEADDEIVKYNRINLRWSKDILSKRGVEYNKEQGTNFLETSAPSRTLRKL